MTATRRILSPVVASVAAGLMVAIASVGSFGGGDHGAAAKGDRFAGIGDTLCAVQVEGEMSDACLAWAEDELTEGAVATVTLASTDADAGVTTLTRVAAVAAY